MTRDRRVDVIRIRVRDEPGAAEVLTSVMARSWGAALLRGGDFRQP
jgi:hypothetical protein